jgi:[CysO sulfur-carrier protein]-S-L-cysteine hydrolase
VRELEIPRTLFEHLFDLADNALPYECVGFLAGIHFERVSAVFPLANVAVEAQKFYLAEPSGVIRAMKAIKNQHLELVGIYHSHPHHAALPSKTDLASATWDVPYLILDVRARQARAWDLLNGELEILVRITERDDLKPDCLEPDCLEPDDLEPNSG